MLRNYVKLSSRNIWKNTFPSLINIAGLTIGISFTFLLGAYIWSELRINTTLRHAENQYFLASEWKDPNMGPDITTLGPLAKRLKEDYPNLVANYYRWDGITSVVSKGEKYFRENIQLGDSTMLSMFGFQLQHGDARTALSHAYSVVITPGIAVKYFGKTDVVGETISIQSFSGTRQDFAITGVLKELEENSVTHLNDQTHNTLFIPTNTFSYFGRLDFNVWTNIYLPSYIELKDGVTAADLEKPIAQLINNNAPEATKQNLTVHPIALKDYYLEKDNGIVKRMVFTLSFVGLFILVMAIINFINISISASSGRMKEIGIRKVMGGLKKQIIIQFLTESVILVSLATILALSLYPFVRPFFEQVTGKRIPALSSFPGYYFFIPVVFTLITGILAGLYPAFVLSSLNTIASLKGRLVSVQENVWLRKSLVGFQFSVAAITMIAAFIVSGQVDHFFSRNLGYNKEYIVSSQLPRDWSPAGVRKMETARYAFQSLPQVSAVSLSFEIPNGMNGGQPSIYKAGMDSTMAVSMQAMSTDANYLGVYEIGLKAGSFFSNVDQDSAKIVLNEKAVQALGWTAEEAIGKQIRAAGDATVYTVQGVTADFHFASMAQKIAPIIFFKVRLTNVYRYLSFKLKPGNISKTVEAIREKWSALLPGSSFEYSFMDDTLKKLYASELQMKRAAYTSTLLALCIVLLGVLGLISLSVQKRTKEIGIRKVLGASVSGIISLFIREFLPVLFIGGIISIPLAWMIMQQWLNNYAYRIDLTVQPFLLSIGILGIITSLVISAQIAKASASNPVKSLRAE